ncbi:MAG: hypothetical protein ACFFCS_05195 [Candidatus Hodarchaeota archaeon]
MTEIQDLLPEEVKKNIKMFVEDAGMEKFIEAIGVEEIMETIGIENLAEKIGLEKLKKIVEGMEKKKND